MKNRRSDRHWRSVLLGVVLCAMLAVLIASKAADAQVVPATTQQRVLQRAANVADVYEKTVSLEAKLALMDERLARIESKIDALSKDMDVVLRVLKRLDPQNQR
jgi:septal ring factor EnvC (AmiA/AmiB activator)